MRFWLHVPYSISSTPTLVITTGELHIGKAETKLWLQNQSEL